MTLRYARMERVWKNDALEEQRALEKLGRYCEAVCTDPDEVLVDVERSITTETGPSKGPLVEVHSDSQSATGGFQIPMLTKTVRHSQLPIPASQATYDKKAVNSERASNKTTRIPMGPRTPRK